MDEFTIPRKRPMDYNEETAMDNKRSNMGWNGGNEPLLKLTVPVYMAGALIGKGGSVMNELKQKHGGNIKISAGKEYYPGTDERVVVLTGTTDQILELNRHINEKMSDPGRDDSMKQITIDERRSRKTKIVLTSLAAGLLIGKGGSTIKGIQTSTSAILSITDSREGPVPGERVLTVIGDLDERTAACQQIVDVIANDASNMANTILRYPQSGVSTAMSNAMERGGMSQEMLEKAVMQKLGLPGGFVDTPSSGGGGGYGSGGGGGSETTRLEAQVEVNVDIPAAIVGGILGKHGAIVKEMSQRSGGAHFKFSEKPNENGLRSLKITGNMQQAYKAFNMVEERVVVLESQQ